MLKRSYRASKERSRSLKKVAKRSFHDDCKQRLYDQLSEQTGSSPTMTSPSLGGESPSLDSATITIVVGRDCRLFAAHEHRLAPSPFLREACRAQDLAPPGQRTIYLPEEEPEVFSLILQYLYQGDYGPDVAYDREKAQSSSSPSRKALSKPAAAGNSLKPPRSGAIVTPSSFAIGEKTFVGLSDAPTVNHSAADGTILRDTAVYCSAHRYDLPALQRLALRKQSASSRIDAGTILRSARFAYAHTPADDARLRAHFLALIIRGRATFARSGTMQAEMQAGGSQLFFDLFVALCQHVDDVEGRKGRSCGESSIRSSVPSVVDK